MNKHKVTAVRLLSLGVCVSFNLLKHAYYSIACSHTKYRPNLDFERMKWTIPEFNLFYFGTGKVKQDLLKLRKACILIGINC